MEPVSRKRIRRDNGEVVVVVHTPYRETVVHNCRNLNDVRRLLVSKIFDLRKSFFLLVFLLGPP